MDQLVPSTIDEEAVPSHFDIPDPVRLAPVISQKSLITPFNTSSNNSYYKMLVPTGKFVNRRSPQKLKRNLELDEVRTNLYFYFHYKLNIFV